MKHDEAIINYAVYENGTELLGHAEVTLPELSKVTAEIKGAGLSGTINAPIAGHFEAMTMTLNFRVPTKQQYALFQSGNHTIDLRAAQQRRDQTTGIVETVNVKHVLTVTPIKLAPGKIAPASTADGSGEYAVTYYATYIDGQKVLEIDIANFVAYINGVDELASVRKALGK